MAKVKTPEVPPPPEPRPHGPAGPGFPTFIEEQPVGYFDKPCSIWQRLPYRSDTGGVSPMWLEGREYMTNERIRGMTPERRAWRKKFLADQVLSAREPVFVPDLYRMMVNPFRRVFRWPFVKVRGYWEPKVGPYLAAEITRTFKIILFFPFVGFIITYYSMFYCNNWMYYKRARIMLPKPIVYPDEPDYPFVSKKKTGEDYTDLGFTQSVLYKSEEQIRAEYEKMNAKEGK